MLYRLSPTGADHETWIMSDVRKTLFVEADDEIAARDKASFDHVGCMKRRSAYDDTPHSPWSNEDLVTAEPVPDAILYGEYLIRATPAQQGDRWVARGELEHLGGLGAEAFYSDPDVTFPSRSAAVDWTHSEGRIILIKTDRARH